MADAHALYQQVILDHNKHPRNRTRVQSYTHKADGVNPLCGDTLSLELRVDVHNIIEAIGFAGEGCAITTASASLMTEALQGQTLAEANALLERVELMLHAPAPAATPTAEPQPNTDLGELAALAGVRDYPMRVKCAALAWQTLHAALTGQAQATTEHTHER